MHSVERLKELEVKIKQFDKDGSPEAAVVCKLMLQIMKLENRVEVLENK